MAPQSLGLGGLAPHNAVLDDHIGEGQADGVQGPQVRPGGPLHPLRRPLHLLQGSGALQGPLVRLPRPARHMQTARRPKQAGEEEQGAGELLRPSAGGGEPVKFLAQDQPAVRAHRQLYVGAPHVHPQNHPPPQALGEPGEDGRGPGEGGGF
jgi:hypothetical protein